MSDQDDQYTIYLIGGEDDEQAVFELVEVGDMCQLNCSYRGKVAQSQATDFFEALCQIRNQLGREGLIPFCYGASMNVYPSGMARQMGAGLKAYKIEMGRQAKMADLVEIFAAGPDVIPCSVDMQREHFDQWIASLSK